MKNHKQSNSNSKKNPVNGMSAVLLRVLALTLVFAVLGLSPAANAAMVEFNGATADIAIVGSTDNGDGTTTYRVVYTFDFSGWDTNCDDSQDDCGALNATHLGAIDFGFGGPENPDAVLVSSPAGVWTLFDVVANASGCDGGGTNSICAMVDPLYTVDVNGGGTFEWVFDVTYSNDYVPSDEDAAIRAWFVQCEGSECTNAGLMSLRTSVPEPGTLGMLGTGLLLLGMTRRRRAAKRKDA